ARILRSDQTGESDGRLTGWRFRALVAEHANGVLRIEAQARQVALNRPVLRPNRPGRGQTIAEQGIANESRAIDRGIQCAARLWRSQGRDLRVENHLVLVVPDEFQD